MTVNSKFNCFYTLNYEKGEIKDTSSKNEVDILHKIRQKEASNQTAHSMSVDNYNYGRIISLNDFVKNLDPNDKALNEKIFIIVYFFCLKYFEQGLSFNQNDLYFKEDNTFPWNFRLELTEKKLNYSYFDPEIFKFINNSIYDGIKYLNNPFLNDILKIIYDFIKSKTDDQTYILKETVELLRSKKNESLNNDYSKIFSMGSMNTISASKNDLHSKYC